MLHMIHKLTLLPLFTTPAAWAHGGEHSEGLLVTLMHTVTEFDHLLAVIGVGILAAFVHRRRGHVSARKAVSKSESVV